MIFFKRIGIILAIGFFFLTNVPIVMAQVVSPPGTSTPVKSSFVPPAGAACSDDGSGGKSCNENGVTVLYQYKCSRKMSTGQSQEVTIPRCVVGGIFDPTDPEDKKCACCGDCRVSRFLSLAIWATKWVLGLSGVAALGVIIYGGLMWILSGGSPDKIEKGKNALTGAVIGVIIVLTAWIVINFLLQSLTGKGIDQIQKDYGADQK